MTRSLPDVYPRTDIRLGCFACALLIEKVFGFREITLISSVSTAPLIKGLNTLVSGLQNYWRLVEDSIAFDLRVERRGLNIQKARRLSLSAAGLHKRAPN